MFSFRSLVLLALLPATVLSSVADVEADIGKIQASVEKLSTEVAAFNGSSPAGILQSLTIHSDAVQLDGVIKKATTDTIATPGPVNVTEATAVLQQLQALQSTIVNLLGLVVAKKADFQAVPVVGVPAQVKGDVTNLNSSTKAFEDALITKTPVELAPKAVALVAPINQAFEDALKAYDVV